LPGRKGKTLQRYAVKALNKFNGKNGDNIGKMGLNVLLPLPVEQNRIVSAAILPGRQRVREAEGSQRLNQKSRLRREQVLHN
jgi:hypothetical protein